MASFYPCIKNGASGYTFYVSLVSQANTKIMQANPTLAAGDFKIAIDDGAPANLGTLPTVDADFTKRVKVVLSQAETNGDNLTIICSDAAGAEWCDLTINIQTVPRRFDDLAYPATSGRSLDVDASGRVVLQAITHTGATVPAVTDVTNGVGITAAAVNSIWDELTAEARTAGSYGQLLKDYLNASISAVKAKTDSLTFTAANKVDAGLNIAADLAVAVANRIADCVLRRTYANARASSDGDAVNFRSLLGAVGKLVNKWSISGTTLTVFQEDDTTSTAPGGTQAITATAGADPITALDTT